MATTQEKVDDSIRYIWIQIENWLKNYYKAPIQVEVRSSRDIYKEGRLAKTVFDGTKIPKVYIDYNLLKKGNKKEILYAGCREAVRIGLAYNKYPFSDTDIEFRAELKRHKLPDYAGLSETGTGLYTYRCTKCKKIYMVRLRPMKHKEREYYCYNEYVRTECCNMMIEDAGRIMYNNEELQEIARKFKLDITKEGNVEV